MDPQCYHVKEVAQTTATLEWNYAGHTARCRDGRWAKYCYTGDHTWEIEQEDDHICAGQTTGINRTREGQNRNKWREM